MFGIDKVREQVNELAKNVHQLFDREHSSRTAISALSKRIVELSNKLTTITEETPQRVDQLAIAISKCSLDMAELDRRLCALEDAITIVPNRKYAAARSEQVTLDDDGIDELAKVFEKASWEDKHLSAGKAVQQMLPLRQRNRHRHSWVARWRAYCEEMTVRDAEIIEAVSHKQDRHGNRFNEDMLRASLAGGIILHLRTNPAVTLRHASYIESPTKRSDGRSITRRFVVSIPDCEYGGVIRIGMETEAMAELICDQWDLFVNTLRAEIVAQEKKGKGKQ